METNSFFDINRFKYVLLRQISINYKTMLIATGAVVGFLMLFGTWNMYFLNKPINSVEIIGVFVPIFLIGGFIFTSIIFSELNSPHKGYLYLTLPASAFEKLISAWLVSSIFYILLGAMITYFINFYYMLVAVIIDAPNVEIVNLFTSDALSIFGNYLIFQTIFFLGAIYFRRVNFLKTLLAGFVLVVLFSIYSGILAKILFNQFAIQSHDMSQSIEFQYTAKNVIAPIAKYLFWYGVAPFFLTVSYFRLKERQV